MFWGHISRLLKYEFDTNVMNPRRLTISPERKDVNIPGTMIKQKETSNYTLSISL